MNPDITSPIFSPMPVNRGKHKNGYNTSYAHLSKANVKLGDIVTYKEGENYITHRVVSAYGDVYTTRGDANSSKDDPIVKEQIVGKVTKILPAFGIFKKTILMLF